MPAARPRSLAQLVADVSAQITRLKPSDALAAQADGSLLIDIRSSDARARDGVIPGALPIPRTVLEWRLAPDSQWRSPHAGSPDQPLILICEHGFSSILAAGSLVELGFPRAGDVAGGFAAWRAAGLPTKPWHPDRAEADQLPGMAGPD
jgi:rhodanese-related sulfurtransferase